MCSGRNFEKYFPDYVSIYECSRFYSDNFETTDWIDSLILKIEEERIANEIAEMETEFGWSFVYL